MRAETFARQIQKAGIRIVAGVPDSTLRQFCGYINNGGREVFEDHIVTADEGAAIGIAIGEYLSTGRPACVYMQNSGLGNAVNPITSLANREVYGIPMLFVIGWRGEPGSEDEPQHRFMGRATLGLLELLEIPYAVIDDRTTDAELEKYLERAAECFENKEQFALVIKRGAFDKEEEAVYGNVWTMQRERAIEAVVDWLQPEDIVVSTTGKISRELYERLDEVKGNHRQAFLTVGGMGHANMIACQLAKRKSGRKVVCLDGDGAILMHMGSLAVIGEHPAANLVHICLNNQAHESVGGMPTGAVGVSYSEIARDCGYTQVYKVTDPEELKDVLSRIRKSEKMVFLEVNVTIGSRGDLGRPRETAEDNKTAFMEYLEQNEYGKGIRQERV